MSRLRNQPRSVIPVVCLLVLLLLATVPGFVAADGSSAKFRKSSTSTNTVLPMPVAMLEGTILDALGSSHGRPDFAEITQSMLSHVQGCPPAAEPALVDLLVLLGGNGAPPFIMGTVGSGRGATYSSSVGRGGIGLLASAHGYEDLPITYASPIVLDFENALSPDQIANAASPHLYSFDESHTAIFDMNGDGYKDLTEWLAPGLGLLVFPSWPGAVTGEPGSWTWVGPISGQDLIGTVGGYRNGFERLRAFDQNADSRVEGGELAGLFIWTDTNGDAVPDAGELAKPDELDVAELVIPESGIEGSFTRTDMTTGNMWDWWPTYAPLRPIPEKSALGKAAYWNPAALSSILELIGEADVVTTVSAVQQGIHESPVTINLLGLGLNANESLMACLDAAGDHIAYVDYRPNAPHTARIWVLSRGVGFVWNVHRFPVPEGDVGQVTFDEAGSQLLVMTRAETQAYILTGWPDGNGQAFRVVWTGGGARGFRGSAFAAHGEDAPLSGEYYIPAYIHETDGTPLCDALMHLVVSGTSATLTPVSDIHALAGEYLPSLDTGLLPAFAYYLKSPNLSFALAKRDAEETTVLVAIYAGAPGNWQAEELDEAVAITNLSASGTRVEYVAERMLGQWEVCWGEAAGPGKAFSDELRIPTEQRPSYPELADSGTRMLWLEFDWAAGTSYMQFRKIEWAGKAWIESDGLQGAAKAQSARIDGTWRVAEKAPVYAAQTTEGVMVGDLYGDWEGPNVPVTSPLGRIILAALLALVVACPLRARLLLHS